MMVVTINKPAGPGVQPAGAAPADALVRCSACGQHKPVSEFYLESAGPRQGKPRSWCKACCKASSAQYYRNHSDARQAYALTYREGHRAALNAYAAAYKARKRASKEGA